MTTMKKKKIQRDKFVSIDKNEPIDDIIRKCVHNTLVAVGDDPNREGLRETPDRVMRMYKEVFEGMRYSNKQIAKMFDKCFEDVETGDLVVVGDIDIHSYCEHHLQLMFDMKVWVGYIPNGKVIGLSKIARIADMCSKRLQLQERIGMDIADVLRRVLDTDDIIVVIEGKHGCMAARGVEKVNSKTRTAALRGKFETDKQLRQEFYSLIK